MYRIRKQERRCMSSDYENRCRIRKKQEQREGEMVQE